MTSFHGCSLLIYYTINDECVCVCGIFRWSAVAPVVIRRKTTLTLKKVASISRPVISVHTRKLGGNNLNRTEENVNYVVELALRSGGGGFYAVFFGRTFFHSRQSVKFALRVYRVMKHTMLHC